MLFFFLHNKVPSLLIYHCQIPSKPLYLMKKKRKQNLTANTNHEDTKQKAIKLQKKHHHLEKKAEKQTQMKNKHQESERSGRRVCEQPWPHRQPQSSFLFFMIKNRVLCFQAQVGRELSLTYTLSLSSKKWEADFLNLFRPIAGMMIGLDNLNKKKVVRLFYLNHVGLQCITEWTAK